jgi:hypothetical protein
MRSLTALASCSLAIGSSVADFANMRAIVFSNILEVRGQRLPSHQTIPTMVAAKPIGLRHIAVPVLADGHWHDVPDNYKSWVVRLPDRNPSAPVTTVVELATERYEVRTLREGKGFYRFLTAEGIGAVEAGPKAAPGTGFARNQ